MGVIGVVAALTLPTLINNYDVSVSITKFKKDISMLSQAAATSKILYGYDFSDIHGRCDDGENGADAPKAKTVCGIFNGTIKGVKFLGWADRMAQSYRIPYTRSDAVALDSATHGYAYLFLDGSIFIHTYYNGYLYNCHVENGESVTKEWITNNPKCLAFIDINGTDGPNRVVSCSGDTKTEEKPEEPCVVKKDSQYISDVYPVVYHDSYVEPASNAAMGIFLGMHE